MPRAIHLLAGALLGSPVACYHGSDAAKDSAGGSAEGGSAESAGDDDSGLPEADCEHPELRGQGDVAMRRLTRDELLATIAAIVGPTVMESADVLAAAELIPAESPGDLVADFQNGHAVEHANGILLTSEAIAYAVGDDGAARDAVFGACASAADVACAEQFLDAQALRILKRPIDDARRQALLDAFTAEGAGLAGLQQMLAQLLQAPEFVFQLEVVRADAETIDGVIALDDWSVASRLAYAITGQGPDDELLAAAAAGEMRTATQARAHAQRLLLTPQARRQFGFVLDSWLKLKAVPDANALLAEIAGIERDGLAEEARQELLEYAEHLVFDLDADAGALMDTAVGFPRSERVAKLYGTSIVAGDEPVELTDGHGGLLLRLAPLLSGHPHTSPILRGAYVRKRILCDELPPPDPDAVSEGLAEAEAADRTMLSNREIVEQITADPLCSSCHQQVNPLGFALESFDPLGQWRTEEIVYDADGNELARHAIDTAVEAANVTTDGPLQLAGAKELDAALAESPRVRACIAERLYTQAQLRPAEAADECAISIVEQALVDGTSVKDAWLAAIVNAELFVRKAQESP